MNEQTEQPINLAEYSYPVETQVSIPGKLVDALLDVLDKAELRETHMSFIDSVPVAVKKGEIEWNKHANQEEFFSQQPQKTLTYEGARLLELKFILLNLKLDSVHDGLAVKTSELGQMKEEIKL